MMNIRTISMATLSVALAVGLTGCNNKSKSAEETAATQPSAFVEPAPVVEPAPQPAPAAAAPAPAPAPKPIGTKKAASSSTSTTEQKSTTTVKPTAKAKEVYVVQQGDTLTAIAKRVYGDPNKVKAIVAANPGLDPNKIKVGQKIVLP